MDIVDDTCAWCSQRIEGFPFVCDSPQTTLEFCDIACAHLYNDMVERIVPRKRENDKMNTKGLFSPLSARLYNITRSTVFDMLPVYKLDSEYDSVDAKAKYVSILEAVF